MNVLSPNKALIQLYLMISWKDCLILKGCTIKNDWIAVSQCALIAQGCNTEPGTEAAIAFANAYSASLVGMAKLMLNPSHNLATSRDLLEVDSEYGHISSEKERSLISLMWLYLFQMIALQGSYLIGELIQTALVQMVAVKYCLH